MADAAVPVRELLVIELLGGIGDTLVALPAVHGLARAHPHATVRVLTFAPGDALLDRDPYVHEVVGVPKEADAAAAVATQLDRVQPDLAVSTTAHSGLPALLRARVSRVVADLWRRPPVDELVERRFLRLLAADGLVSPGDVALPLRVYLDAEEIGAARLLVPEPRPLVLLPDTGMPVKRWPRERWEQLAARYDGPVLSVGVAVAGSRLLPALSLRGLAAVLAVAAGRGGRAVGVDTGPLRLASAVGLPAVALHGPSTAGRYGLSGPGVVNLQGLPGCRVRRPENFTEQECWWSAQCPLSADGSAACMADLGAEQVAQSVGRLRGWPRGEHTLHSP